MIHQRAACQETTSAGHGVCFSLSSSYPVPFNLISKKKRRKHGINALVEACCELQLSDSTNKWASTGVCCALFASAQTKSAPLNKKPQVTRLYVQHLEMSLKLASVPSRTFLFISPKPMHLIPPLGSRLPRAAGAARSLLPFLDDQKSRLPAWNQRQRGLL